MTPDEMRPFEEHVVDDEDKPAGKTPDEQTSEHDRLTKSGRLKIEDVQKRESTD